MPEKIVSSFGAGGQEESFTADLAVGPLLARGRALISLLRGGLPPGYDRRARQRPGVTGTPRTLSYVACPSGASVPDAALASAIQGPACDSQ